MCANQIEVSHKCCGLQHSIVLVMLSDGFAVDKSSFVFTHILVTEHNGYGCDETPHRIHRTHRSL